MALDLAAEAGRNAAIYRALQRRNRFIGFLRLGVPLFGVLVLGALVVQIVVANLGQDFGIDGVRFSRDAVVIDAPHYQGVMANGTRYAVSAAEASVNALEGDTIALETVTLDLTRPDGTTMRAVAQKASFALEALTVRVAGVMDVSDSRGVAGRLADTTIDWQAQTITARGPVDIRFADGSALTGAGMVYNAADGIWTFGNVRLTVPDAE